jgi:von Willebrand factor type D domain
MIRPRRTVSHAGLALVTASAVALLAVSANATPSAHGSVGNKPRAPVAPPVERLVLGPADAPGLKPKRGSAAQGAKAVGTALRPSRYRAPHGAAKVSHFESGQGELWSLAYVEKSAGAAKSDLARIIKAAQRAGLKPGKATAGQEGYAIASRRPGSAIVLWRRGSAVGEILLAMRLSAKLRRSIAVQYAAVADGHMAHLLYLDAWQRTLGDIRPDGTVPRKVALDLFALAYGPLPGTKRPRGPHGPPHEDAFFAETALLRYWSTLTPAQQAAAAAALGVPGVRLGGKVSRSSQAASRGATYGDPLFVEDDALEKVAYGFESIYAERLDHILKLRIVAGRTSEASSLAAGTVPINDAYFYDDVSPTICRIRLYPIGQAITNVRYRDWVIAHEVFHCFQADLVGSALPQKAPWLVEGSASWAAHSVNQIDWGFARESSKIETYLDAPDTPLFQRVYDAVGFFGHGEETTGNLWPRIAKVLTAPGNEASFLLAGGAYSQMLDSWGSSTFNWEGWGQAWTFTDPLQPPNSVVPAYTPITDDATVYAGPYTFARYAIYAYYRPNTLIHVQIAGPARLNVRLGASGYDITNLKDAWFWLGKGTPKCPPRSQGVPPPALAIGDLAPLGIAAGSDPTLGFVSFVPLEKYCKQKQKPPKPASGGPAGGGGGGGGNSGGGGGSSFSDPHLVTFDGGWYDFQGAGEYTLARSPSGDLDVQIREQPLSMRLAIGRAIAINTALAMRVAGDRVGVYTPGLEVRVNGRGFIPTKRAQRLPRGGSVRLADGQVEVRWPDSSLVRVMAAFGLGVLVQPAAARQGTLTGMFGNFDANPDNDFVTRSGTRLDPDKVPRSYRLLYHVFGDSWRITQGQSLFDYARGESTRTFTKRNLPTRLTAADLLSPRQLRMATRICRALHITKRQVFQACLLDVGFTGNGAFATSSAQAERTAGGFPVPHRAKKPKKGTKPGRAKGTTTWARAAAAQAGTLSVAVVDGKVVVGYRSGQGSADAITFTPSAARDVASPSRDRITSGWDSIGDPTLLPHAGGGLQALLTGIHGGNGDPLNGVSFAVRNANGGFAPPALAATSTYAEFVVGDAVLAPDGAPIWAADRGGTLWLWRGAVAAVGVDHSGLAGGPAGNASVGRDKKGRYWLAWNTVFASDAKRNGLYLQQFDPKTLQTIGPAQQAPSSAAMVYSGHLALACWTVCRLVYQRPAKRGLEIVSWAPGERKATIVAPAKSGHSLGQVAAAYTSAGRLWVAWWDNGGNAGFGYRAALGSVRGAQAKGFSIGRPSGGDGGPISAVSVGGKLVLVTVAKGSAPYVNVLGP